LWGVCVRGCREKSPSGGEGRPCSTERARATLNVGEEASIHHLRKKEKQKRERYEEKGKNTILATFERKRGMTQSVQRSEGKNKNVSRPPGEKRSLKKKELADHDAEKRHLGQPHTDTAHGKGVPVSQFKPQEGKSRDPGGLSWEKAKNLGRGRVKRKRTGNGGFSRQKKEGGGKTKPQSATQGRFREMRTSLLPSKGKREERTYGPRLKGREKGKRTAVASPREQRSLSRRPGE